MLVVAVCEEGASAFPILRLQQDISRGQVCLKIVTMRKFTGNMISEL